MVTFAGVTDVQECGKLCELAANYVTEEFAALGWPQMSLEFEKIFWPYLLAKKKRYVGDKWEPVYQDGVPFMVRKGIDIKGFETERKDTLPLLKDMMHAVIDALMVQNDEKEAMRRVTETMQQLIRNEVPMEKLIMSQALSSKVVYKTDSNVVASVNKQRRDREKGSEEAVGGRVEYVIVKGYKKSLTTKLAKCPEHVVEDGDELNTLWYFEHAIEKPMLGLLEVVEGIDLKPAFERFRAQLNRERLGVTSLASVFGETGETSAEGGGSSSTMQRKAHIPRPPPPPPKRGKRAK